MISAHDQTNRLNPQSPDEHFKVIRRVIEALKLWSRGARTSDDTHNNIRNATLRTPRRALYDVIVFCSIYNVLDSTSVDSSTITTNIMSNPISHQPIISHHVHSDNEPLPGARGAAPAVDYTPETIEHAKLPPSEVGNTQDFAPHPKTVHNEEFPTVLPEPPTQHHEADNSAPTRSKPKLADKIVGKTQEVSQVSFSSDNG